MKLHTHRIVLAIGTENEHAIVTGIVAKTKGEAVIKALRLAQAHKPDELITFKLIEHRKPLMFINHATRLRRLAKSKCHITTNGNSIK